MRQKRVFTMFALALVIALGAAWMAQKWVEKRLSRGDAEGVSVVVAALEIPFGKKIEEADLRMIRMPEAAVPKGAYREVAEVTGLIAIQTIYPGESVINGRVMSHNGGSALSAVISPNARAVTVRVNDVVGVAGFLLPGNRVDVIATKGKGKSVKSYTLVQDKKVLAVDQTASPDKNDPVIVRAVTLELTPDEAEQLVKATQEGVLQMALRNPLDNRVVEKVPESKPVVAKPKPKPSSVPNYVTIIKGMEVERHRVRM